MEVGSTHFAVRFCSSSTHAFACLKTIYIPVHYRNLSATRTNVHFVKERLENLLPASCRLLVPTFHGSYLGTYEVNVNIYFQFLFTFFFNL